MATLGEPLAEGMQTGPKSVQEPLSPMEVLSMFCATPTAIEAYPKGKVTTLFSERVALRAALKLFMHEESPRNAKTLLAQIEKTTQDPAILYFAASLWANPATGEKVLKELEKSPPKSNSGKLLHTLMKGISLENAASFWARTEGTVPCHIRLQLDAKKGLMEPSKKLLTPQSPTKAAPRPYLRAVR